MAASDFFCNFFRILTSGFEQCAQEINSAAGALKNNFFQKRPLGGVSGEENYRRLKHHDFLVGSWQKYFGDDCMISNAMLNEAKIAIIDWNRAENMGNVKKYSVNKKTDTNSSLCPCRWPQRF